MLDEKTHESVQSDVSSLPIDTFSRLQETSRQIIPVRAVINNIAYTFDGGWKGFWELLIRFCLYYRRDVFDNLYNRSKTATICGKKLFLTSLKDHSYRLLEGGYVLNIDFTPEEIYKIVGGLLRAMRVNPDDVLITYMKDAEDATHNADVAEDESVCQDEDLAQRDDFIEDGPLYMDDDEPQSLDVSEDSSDFVCVDFKRLEDYEPMRPVSCAIHGENVRFSKTWRDLYQGIVEFALTSPFAKNVESLDKRGISLNAKHPFLTKERRLNLSNPSRTLQSRQLSNKLWLYINYSNKEILGKIRDFCRYVGFEPDTVKIKCAKGAGNETFYQDEDLSQRDDFIEDGPLYMDDDEPQSLDVYEDSSDFVYVDFERLEDYAPLRPVSCTIYETDARFSKTWRDLYAAIVNFALTCPFAKNVDSLDKRGISPKARGPLLTKDRRSHSSNPSIKFRSRQLTNGYWLYVQYSNEKILRCIRDFCSYVGFDLDQVKIKCAKGAGASSRSLLDNADEEAETTEIETRNEFVAFHESEDCAKVLQYIRENYSRGFSFEPATISLVEQELGVSFRKPLRDELMNRMVKRADDTWILADSIADEDATRQIREEVQGFLKEFGCFELEEIYRRYSKFLNGSTIRDSSDFGLWLGSLWRSETLKFITFNGYRIGRRKGSGTTKDDLMSSLVETIRSRVQENYGTLEEDEIKARFTPFSLDFLKKLIQTEADDLFIRDINEILCIQDFDGLGISDDFSETLAETLDELDDLEIEPELEAIHTLLCSKTGENIRNSYGIPDDKSFKKLIEVYYQGSEKRRWQGDCFRREE